MALTVANVEVTTDNFQAWVDKTNSLADKMTNYVITANATTSNTTGNAQLIGIFGANTLVATDDIRGGNVSSSAELNISSNVAMGGYATVANDFTVSGATYLVTANTSGFANIESGGTVNDWNVGEDLTIANNTTANTLNATGAVDFDSTLNVDGHSNVATIHSSGLANLDSADIRGALDITGATTVSTLTSSGLANLDSLDVVGNTDVSGSLNVTGDISVANITSTGLANLASANVVGALDANSTLNVVGHTNVATIHTSGHANIAVGNVAGNLHVTGKFSVTGNVSLSSNTTISGRATVSNTVTIKTHYVIDVASNTDLGSNTSSPQVVFTFDKTTYKSARIEVQSENAGEVQLQDAVVSQNTTASKITVFGTVYTSANELGNLSTDISGSNVRVLYTQDNANTEVKVVAHLIK